MPKSVFVFGLCTTEHHQLCPGELTRPGGQSVSCTCDCHTNTKETT